MSMLVEAIIGFALGYVFVQLLPYVWLLFVILWELITSFFELVMTFCESVATYCNTLKTAFIKHLKTSNNLTTKDKIELIVGFVGLSYTALLIGIAFLTNLPNDFIVVSWLVLTAISSCVGNRYLKQLPSHAT